MTDEQLREAVARAIEAADLARPHDPYNHLALADAAIALMRPVISAQALEDVVQMLAGREDLINAVQFRHIAAAIRALKG